MPVKLLLSPLAEGAFFARTVEVARAALADLHPDADVSIDQRATVTFLDLHLDDAPVSDAVLSGLVRLPFAQALFRPRGDGGLDLIDVPDGLHHPPELVFATKYRGKTHELVTQLALELALHHAEGPVQRLLDPMAGRGTTLLWGLRYGLDGTGVEIDPQARQHLHRDLKRQTKVLRLKHKQGHGSVGPKRADQHGRYVDYRFRPGSLRLVTGDARDLSGLLGPRTFDVLVTDLPYGVQFKGDPLAVLRACAPGWARALRAGGAAAIVFNRLRPRRHALSDLFAREGLEVLESDLHHRMSESIERDVLLLRRT